MEDLKEAVIDGNAEKVKEYIEIALAEKMAPAEIINDGLIMGMNIIGISFKNNEVYVSEVLVAARAMQIGMAMLKPMLAKEDIQEKGTVVIGTVKGDLHDIGKNLVIIMLEGSGYKVIDLGIDVTSEKFIQAVEEHKPQIVGLSALLSTTMVQMKNTVAELKACGKQVKILVGGAPVTQNFAEEIGADAYAANAASAVERVNELVAS